MKLIVLNILIFCASIYFGAHLLYGPKNYFQFVEFSKAFKEKYRNYSNLNANRVVLESKASLLNRSVLDLDTLDEYARKVLGLAKPNELIIPVKNRF
ncbi:hypothetical protein phytr_5100 [Candidatus Phycorickettsia trachydisci]|uniref:Septum formation initiator n=1 Tax=Candidatus Phycorickettsia trachydisci TaxID=2115978 RepID=A0A2P1P876_9RICK|nr:septum formation initiator family protein [Candidatus Phycorickettsia trachydisci]AVP87457.1 hypothetical protein phytr_5100 [Candidatus Phycorickettsia trachydisci]